MLHGIRKLRALALLLFAALAVTATPAAAEDYPTRPIRVLVGFPAGSGADILSRHFANKMQNMAGQPIVVENRPGANGNIAIGIGVKAKPDGYTILLSANTSILASDLLYKDIGFEPQKDLVPAALYSESAFILVVPATSKANTVAELTEHLKSLPASKFGYANQTSQIAAEYYRAVAGISAVPVSYRGGSDAVLDLITGTLDYVFIDGTVGMSQIKAGKLKALAVTTATRHPSLPDVPTMQEAGMPSDFELSAWWGAYLPTGTPPEIVAKIGGWMNAASAAPDTKEFLGKLLGIPLHADAKGAAERIARETPRWANAIRTAGIKPQ